MPRACWRGISKPAAFRAGPRRCVEFSRTKMPRPSRHPGWLHRRVVVRVVDGARGRSGRMLAEELSAVVRALSLPPTALPPPARRRQRRRGRSDRIVVFGSFHTVGPALDWLERRDCCLQARAPEYTIGRIMDRRVKERLIGASILVAIVVLVVPELLSGPKPWRTAAGRRPPRPEPTRNVTVDLTTSKPPANQRARAPLNLRRSRRPRACCDPSGECGNGRRSRPAQRRPAPSNSAPSAAPSVAAGTPCAG